MPPSTETYVRIPGSVLDRADPVQRDGGLRDDRPSRLGQHPSVEPGVAARLHHGVAPLGDRRGLLGLDVGDPQTAADRQLGQTELAHPRRDDLDGLVEEVGDEDLAADVHVHTDELHRGESAARATAAAASPEATPNPNFESTWPVRTNSCVCASMPGVTRISTLGTTAVLRVEGSQAVELVEAVDHDPTDARRPRRSQLAGGLVVAVEDEAARRNARGEGDMELAAGGHVDVHALLMREAGHGQAQEGLAGVGHTVAEGGHGLPAAGTEVGLVVDEQRRAELGRQVTEIETTDAEAAVCTDLRAVGQEPSRDRTAHRPPQPVPVLGLKMRARARQIARERGGGAGVTSPPGRRRRAGRGRWPDPCGRTRPATAGPG